MNEMLSICPIRTDHVIECLRPYVAEQDEISSISERHRYEHKVVYEVRSKLGFTCMLYIWHDSVDVVNDCYSSDASLYELNHLFLSEYGIPTPEIYVLNRERDVYPFDYAIVKSLPHTLQTFLSFDHNDKALAFRRLADIVQNMHHVKKIVYGKLNEHHTWRKERYEQIILSKMLAQLDYIARHVHQIHLHADHFATIIEQLYHQLIHRDDYRFIHCALGPQNVGIDDKLELYLLHIEGMMFFDVEYEYSYMQIGFDADFDHFKRSDLDEDRLLFYKLHHHIAHIYNGLTYKKLGKQNVEMEQFLKFNLDHTLQFLHI